MDAKHSFFSFHFSVSEVLNVWWCNSVRQCS